MIDNSKAIDTIIDNFDFDKVQKAMQSANWTWGLLEGGHGPTVSELEETARWALRTALERKHENEWSRGGSYSAGTGGFTATHHAGTNVLTLEFVMEDYSLNLNTGIRTFKS